MLLVTDKNNWLVRWHRPSRIGHQSLSVIWNVIPSENWECVPFVSYAKMLSTTYKTLIQKECKENRCNTAVFQMASWIRELNSFACSLTLWSCPVASSMFSRWVSSTLSIALAGIRKAGWFNMSISRHASEVGSYRKCFHHQMACDEFLRGRCMPWVPHCRNY